MPRRKKEVAVPEEDKVPAEEPSAAQPAPMPEPEAAAPEPVPEPGAETVPVPEPAVTAQEATEVSEPAVEPVPGPPVEPGARGAVAVPTSEERWAAAIAHGSILLNLVTGILGPVVALVIWLLYERKSRYVAWHALQAMVFQAVTLLLILAMGAVAGVLWAIVIPLMAIAIGCCLSPFALGFTLLTAALLIGSLIYGCAGALTVLEGGDFRYRWVAEWIPPQSRP